MEYGYEAVRSSKLPITVGRQEYYTNKPSNMHFHNGYELLIVTSGEYKIYAPQKLYEGSGAGAVFFNRGIYHSTVRLNCEVNPFLGFDINFTQDVLDMTPPAFLMASKLAENNVVILPFDEKDLSFFEPKLLEMREKYVATRDSGKTPPILYTQLLSVLNQVAELCERPNAQKFRVGSTSEFYITDVCKKIIEEIDAGHDVGVGELAEKFYVSAGKLSYDFNSLTGISIKQMICELRLQRAKFLLRKGMEVKDVAEKCGFSGDSYFVQFFKKYTGMSPGKYRDEKLKS